MCTALSCHQRAGKKGCGKEVTSLLHACQLSSGKTLRYPQHSTPSPPTQHAHTPPALSPTLHPICRLAFDCHQAARLGHVHSSGGAAIPDCMELCRAQTHGELPYCHLAAARGSPCEHHPTSYRCYSRVCIVLLCGRVCCVVLCCICVVLCSVCCAISVCGLCCVRCIIMLCLLLFCVCIPHPSSSLPSSSA